MSAVTLRVVANGRFLDSQSNGNPTDVERREYTISNFDLRPYLPDNQDTALYKVLKKVEELTKKSKTRKDGIRYLQHAWSQRNDEANLALGIDCSRAIWFTITRAGLPYNKQNDRYLPTSEMAVMDGPMTDYCVPCEDNLRLGDILVYRDAVRGDGHVVMVIDPQKRIAWGSHGWDGNSGETGIEFQKIRVKKDWEKWDRQTMKRVACWRHRQFVEDAVSTTHLGHRALENHCPCNCNASEPH